MGLDAKNFNTQLQSGFSVSGVRVSDPRSQFPGSDFRIYCTKSMMHTLGDFKTKTQTWCYNDKRIYEGPKTY